MYYPIIDKLKEVMAEIGQGGHIVIEASATSEAGGTWIGNLADIETSFANNTPVYCVISAGGQKIMFTLVAHIDPDIGAYCTPIPLGGVYYMLRLLADNTFDLTAV